MKFDKGEESQLMGIVTRRAFMRKEEEAPIVFSICETEEYNSAVMRNCGDGGMYFETKRKLQPGTHLFINLSEGKDKNPPPELSTEGHRAQVMWCRQVENSQEKRYGIGVRFLSNICHQCGQKIHYKEIRKNGKDILLCGRCSSHFEDLSDGKIKWSLEEYLIGNVL
jgi:Tfp pilus assembly protein PilZ